MRHYVMTRSCYGPEWTLEQNRARLEITRAITAKTLKAQGYDDWVWVVLLDERDPLKADRLAVYASAAPMTTPIMWTPEAVEKAPWDSAKSTTHSQRVAATAYKHPGWLASTSRHGDVLQTRLDDDDGLALDYFQRVRAAVAGLKVRTALMLPQGVRVWDGRETYVRHDTNAMHSLWTPKGDETTIYSYGHRLVRRAQPTVDVDEDPAWLWVRHPNTISGWKKADSPISDKTRRLFPIDWSVL